MMKKNYAQFYGCRGNLKTTKQETKLTEAKPNEINCGETKSGRGREEERKRGRVSETDRERKSALRRCFSRFIAV